MNCGSCGTYAKLTEKSCNSPSDVLPLFRSFQMLQLRRTRPPCQRVSAAPSAQKVPFLSECFPHGGQLSAQSTAAAAAGAFVSRLSGNSYLTEGGGRGAKPCRPPLRQLRVNFSSGFIYWSRNMFVQWSADRRVHFTKALFLCPSCFSPLDKCLSLEWNNQTRFWFSCG